MSFDGCWDKRHRDLLQGYIDGTFRIVENRPRIGVNYQAETAGHVVHVSHMPELSEFLTTVGRLVRDKIHALRFALDYVAFEYAIQKTRHQSICRWAGVLDDGMLCGRKVLTGPCAGWRVSRVSS